MWGKLYRYVPPPRRLLLVCPDGLGAIVLMTPMFRAIKTRFPDLQLSVLVRTAFAPLMLQHPLVDDVLEHAWPASTQLLSKAFWQGVHFFEAKNFDTVIHVGFQSLLAWMALAAKIPYRIGLRYRGVPWLTCNADLAPIDDDLTAHQVEINLQLLRPLGINETLNAERDFALHLPVDTASERWFSELLQAQPAPSDAKLLVISIAPPAEDKAWTLEGWTLALKALLERGSYRIILIGHSEHKTLANKILSQLQSVEVTHSALFIDLVGQTTVLQVLSVLRAADVFIGSLSGYLYVASAFSVPTVALLPSKNVSPTRWGPWGTRHLLLRQAHTCPLPCAAQTCTESVCVSAIRPPMLVQAIEKILSGIGVAPERAADEWFLRTVSVLFLLPDYIPEALPAVVEALATRGVQISVYSARAAILPKVFHHLRMVTRLRHVSELKALIEAENITVIHDLRQPHEARQPRPSMLKMVLRLKALAVPVRPVLVSDFNIPQDPSAWLRQYQAAFARRRYVHAV